MIVRRTIKAFLGGSAAFLVLAVLGELTLRAIARLVTYWADAGIPISGWRHTFTETGLFFARYFVFMLPPLFLLCLVGALLAVRQVPRQPAA